MFRKSHCAHTRWFRCRLLPLCAKADFGRWCQRSLRPAIVLFAAYGMVGNTVITAADEIAPPESGDVLVSAAAADHASSGRPRDQLWLVNCRGVSYGRHEDDLAGLRYLVHQPASGWAAASQQAFREGAPEQNTCILVLGNGYTSAQTRSLGATAYRRLVNDLPPECGVRFVIWSWPSDHTDQGPIKDLRAKAGRTPHVAVCLARWLDDMPLPGQVSLLGTSFGARIVMEALELRANGRIGNLSLETAGNVQRRAVHVVLISAAVNNDWLLPGRRLGGALSQTEQLLLVNNSSDPVLKRYHWLYGPRSRAAALGSTGLRFGGGFSENVAQIDAAGIIGRHHGCAPYFDSPRLVAAMRSHLFDTEAESPQLPSPGLQIPVAARATADERQ